jgi:hypothetical protein
MNLARTGTAGVLGLASGALTPPTVAPIVITSTMSVEAGTILEAVALVGGAVMQFASPYSVPDIVDGLVDGGVALLLRRGGIWAMKAVKPAAAYLGAYAQPAGLYGAHAYGAMASPCARGVVGGVADVSRRELV